MKSLEFTHDYVFDQWIVAGKPTTMVIKCPFGVVGASARNELLYRGLLLKIKEQNNRGTVYTLASLDASEVEDDIGDNQDVYGENGGTTCPAGG